MAEDFNDKARAALAPGFPQNPKLIADNDNVSAMFRVQRNWYP